MPTSFCGQCGTLLKEDSRFCPECGWKVISIESKPDLKDEQTNHNPNTESTIQTDLEEVEKPYSSVQYDTSTEYKQAPYTPTLQNREFNPFSQNASTQRPVYAEENKRSGTKMGLIVGISVIVIGLIVIGFMTISFFRGGLQTGDIFGKSDGEQTSSVNENSGIENSVVGKSQSSEIDGDWSINATTDSVLVDGKVAPEYVSLIGKSSKTTMMINAEQGIATVKEPYSGTEIPLPIEYNKDEVTIGDESNTDAFVYSGTLSKKGEGYVIEGNWESKNSEANMVMKGTFTAVQIIPILSQDIINSAVWPSEEELQGVYKGTLKYSKITNLDKLPNEMMSAEQKQMMLDMLNVDMECTGEVDNDDIEISFVVPGFGESSLDDLSLSDMKDGVITMCDIVDEGTATAQLAILGTQGAYRMVGAVEMIMNIPDEDEVVFLMEFDVSYSGPLEN